jgi:hypothetical protein
VYRPSWSRAVRLTISALDRPFIAPALEARRRREPWMQTRRLEKPDEVNLILGQAHFIKTVETFTKIGRRVPGIRLAGFQ